MILRGEYINYKCHTWATSLPVTGKKCSLQPTKNDQKQVTRI